MTDTIGKCECINRSDKLEIDQVITEQIDEQDDKLSNIKRAYKGLIGLGANPDTLAKIHDIKKSRLKNLLTRVRNTPECK